MTVQRLTLLPQPNADGAIPVPQPPEVLSITRISKGAPWRTEAMRSYSRPSLIWFTRGQGRLTVAGQSGGYGAHNAVFLPAGTMHGFTSSAPVLGSVVLLPVGESHRWPSEPLHLRLREVRLQRELTGLIDALDRECQSDAPFSDEAASLQAGLLAVWFARISETQVNARLQSGGNPSGRQLTEAFTALVEREFQRPVGITHFADRLGVTPTHLSRVCRQHSGRPALKILNDRRHFEACRMLSDTSLPISTIAKRTGFSSPAYFTRAFRAASGQSPTEFRLAR